MRTDPARLSSDEPVERIVEHLLVCPRCHGSLETHSGEIRCRRESCGFRGAISDGVVMMGDHSGEASFDDKFEIMQRGSELEGVRCLCYDQQARFFEEYLKPGMVVLDVGCGPALPYGKKQDCFLIGLDASYESLRANSVVNLRVHGRAESLPLPNQTVDIVVCFYSIHHMVGETVEENERIISRVLAELARVVKPGGALLVFDLSPWWPLWLAQQCGWNLARRVFGNRLDMYFWSDRTLSALGRKSCPHANLREILFRTPLSLVIPPMFNLPWLKVPRALYPFDVKLYEFRL